ncbi:MAG TPA: hypothetical protein VK050_11820, partial [Flavobacteriaceae bacterium]|nr:hypothetical protein [Flavobacteriaceae bacterium]
MNKAPALLLYLLFILSFVACTDKAAKKGELTDYITENTTSVWRINDWSNYNALLQSPYATSANEKASEVSKLLEHLQPSNTSLITASVSDSIQYYTIIAPQDSLLLPTDTTKYKILKQKDITKYTSNDYSFYTGIRDSIVLISNDEPTLKTILESDSKSQVELKRLLNVKSKSEIVGLRKNPNASGLSEWSVLDFSQLKDGFLATGVLQSNDSVGYWSNLISGQNPQPIRVANYTPIYANSSWALVYQNAELLKNKIEIHTKKAVQTKELDILEASDELSCINLPNGNAFGINSLDRESLMQLLVTDITLDEVYRESQIYAVENKKLLENVKLAFCEDIPLNYLVAFDTYFIFVEDKDLAKEFITTQINQHSLANVDAYKESAKTLSSNASLVYYGLDGKTPRDLQKQTALEIFGSKNTLGKSQFPLLVLQLNADKGFSHIN